MSIIDRLHELALANPNQLALVVEKNKTYTYQELYEFSMGLRESLNVINIASRTRIAMITEFVHLIPLLSPIIAQYYTVTVINPLDPLEKKIKKLKDLKIEFILTDVGVYPKLSCDSLNLNYLVFNEEGILVDTKMNRVKTQKSGSNDVAIISESSGTTTTPKVIPISYKQLLSRIYSFERYQLDSSRIRLNVSPIQRTSTITNLLQSLYWGTTSIFSNGINYTLIDYLLNTHHVTDLRIAPASLTSYLSFIEKRSLPIPSSLKYIFIPGAYLSDHLYQMILKTMPQVSVIHTYGLTETGNVTSNFDAPMGYKQGSVGISKHHQIRIVDNEIQIKGDAVFEGYEGVNNHDFFDDSWFKTGDLGVIEEGYLYIKGRLKEMINLGGEKVSPYEIEGYLINLKIFQEVIVFPYFSPTHQEMLACAIVASKDDYTLANIRELLINKLPAFKLPTRLYVLKEIPKNNNGKFERNKLFALLEGKQTPYLER